MNDVSPRTARLLRQLDLHLVEVERALLAAGPAGQAASTALAQARAVLAEARAVLAEARDELAEARDELRTERLADRAARGAGAGQGRVRRVELPVDPRSAHQARAFCAQTAELWALRPSVASAATDIASELVANACAHSSAHPVLALELGPEAVLVRVWDDGPGTPRLRPYRPGLSERGLGLRLVKQLSSHWGVAADGDGKWVWARLPVPEDL